MKQKQVYNIETYDELLQCAESRLNIPTGSEIEVKKDLILQVRDMIMKNQCKDADILAPYLNQFFIDDKDKLIKDMIGYYMPELNMVDSGKYEPYEKMSRQDFVAMWIPKGLWERFNKLEETEEWLSQTPNVTFRN